MIYALLSYPSCAKLLKNVKVLNDSQMICCKEKEKQRTRSCAIELVVQTVIELLLADMNKPRYEIKY